MKKILVLLLCFFSMSSNHAINSFSGSLEKGVGIFFGLATTAQFIFHTYKMIHRKWFYQLTQEDKKKLNFYIKLKNNYSIAHAIWKCNKINAIENSNEISLDKLLFKDMDFSKSNFDYFFQNRKKLEDITIEIKKDRTDILKPLQNIFDARLLQKNQITNVYTIDALSLYKKLHEILFSMKDVPEIQNQFLNILPERSIEPKEEEWKNFSWCGDEVNGCTSFTKMFLTIQQALKTADTHKTYDKIYYIYNCQNNNLFYRGFSMSTNKLILGAACIAILSFKKVCSDFAYLFKSI